MKESYKYILLLITTAFSFILGYVFNNNILVNHIEQDTEVNSTTEQKYQYSYLNNKSFFEESFEGLPEIKNNLDIKSIIVPHHLIAKKLIAENFNQVKTEKEITVFLISPNHFSTGQGELITSKSNWKTPYGILEPDLTMISLLKNQNLVNVDETPFPNEHGISGITPFIKRNLPNAKIVPIIVKDITREEKLNNFIEQVSNNLPSEYLFVASLDFCHNTNSDLCDNNDAQSISILEKFDYENYNAVDVDSPKTLKIIMEILDKTGYKNFELISNTNSTKVLNNPDWEEVVSYIGGYFSKGEPKKTLDETNIWFFGDMMLDRYIRNTIDKKGVEHLFVNLKDDLLKKDLVVANLEGSFTDYKPKALAPNNLSFTFDPNIVPVLKNLNFGLFSLANNHSLNFGKEGLAQSKKYLEENDIDCFGDPLNQDLSFIKEINSYQIGFVGYHEFSNPDLEPILTEIDRLINMTDLIIVSPHWGIEYQSTFSQSQQSKAHKFIDAGADIVIGHHPHVIQPVEIYKGKAIFYSLGNFIFDQTFSIETQQGMSVNINLNNNEITYKLINLESKNLQVDYINQDKEEKLLQDISEKSILTNINTIKEFTLDL